MTSTLENLIAILRRRLKDQEFDEDSCKEYINDSQHEILMDGKWPFLERIDVYDTTPDGIISLPATASLS